MAATLSKEEITTQLQELNDWNLIDNAIQKEWIFKDFNTAIVFINVVAHLAEQHDHHPDILNTYNRVQLRLHTHSAKGITRHDFLLAKSIDQSLGP